MICPECNGRGETTYYVETDRDENTVTVVARKDICHTCNGSGKMPMTNADRIRAMSDEELANFFADKIENEYILSQKRLGYSEHTLTATQMEAIRHNCYCIWMRWLKQPVETENVDRCVCCGAIIPEGQIVCPNCLVTVKQIS